MKERIIRKVFRDGKRGGREKIKEGIRRYCRMENGRRMKRVKDWADINGITREEEEEKEGD